MERDVRTGGRHGWTGADEKGAKERAALQSWLAGGFQALAVGTLSAVGSAGGHDESLADQVAWSLDA